MEELVQEAHVEYLEFGTALCDVDHLEGAGNNLFL